MEDGQDYDPGGSQMETILRVEELKISFLTLGGTLRAVDEVNFEVKKNEVFGLVGESGCGKSTTALSIMRLLDETAKLEGKILLGDTDLLQLTKRQMKHFWGSKLYMVFQDPMTSLNPVMKIKDQIGEVLRRREGRSLKDHEIQGRGRELLQQVDIPDSVRVLNQYPHQLSGGMKQRIMIGMGLAIRPDVLVLDEPTTALDSTVQFKIVELLWNLKMKYRMSQIIITHDFGVAAKLCDRIAVMYAGKIVEQGKYVTILKEPAHPYTRGLFKCIITNTKANDVLETMKGYLPSLHRLPRGCYFQERCEIASPRCKEEPPPLIDLGNEHFVACRQFNANAS